MSGSQAARVRARRTRACAAPQDPARNERRYMTKVTRREEERGRALLGKGHRQRRRPFHEGAAKQPPTSALQSSFCTGGRGTRVGTRLTRVHAVLPAHQTQEPTRFTDVSRAQQSCSCPTRATGVNLSIYMTWIVVMSCRRTTPRDFISRDLKWRRVRIALIVVRVCSHRDDVICQAPPTWHDKKGLLSCRCAQ